MCLEAGLVLNALLLVAVSAKYNRCNHLHVGLQEPLPVIHKLFHM